MACCSTGEAGSNKSFRAAAKITRGGTLKGLSLVLPTSIILASGAVPSRAASTTGTDSLDALQNSISTQEAKLKKLELQLEQQSLQLDQQQMLLNSEMAKLRGTGTGSTTQTPQVVDTIPNGTTSTEAPVSGTVGEQQQQQQQQQNEQKTKRILQTATNLSNSGGILTPRDQFVIDPSIEYDYYAQNQLALNGFTIIPGITFGNIFISRSEQHFLTPALTMRYGVTNDFEINAKVPFVVGYGTLVAQAAGPSAQPITANANNANIGDIQVGASYQFNNGYNGWPVFVGNLEFKSVTGVNPYEVPVYTVSDPNGAYLAGIQKKLPTGTGFYSLQPSLTIFYPTDPGVIFGNIQYIKNFSRTLDVQNPAGGAGIPENLQPGSAVDATFGLGFAMNDKASMTFSYEQEHVFGASVNNRAIVGSSYDIGTFNFGVGYELSKRTNVNLGIGIGVGPNSPAAKILIEFPIRFNGF